MANRADAQARIDAALSDGVSRGDVPGVVAMATDGNGVLYQGAFGVRDLGNGPAMTVDTVFRIASMTKAITSVAAMQLVEAGKLTLDDPVRAIDVALSEPKVLEGFDGSGAPILRPAKQPITLRHLLTHTAGFTYEAWNANTFRYVRETGVPSTQTGLKAALRLPLAFDPGDKWEYGINIDWIGLLIEAASGQSIDVYLREHILAPLGMNDTGFVASPEQRARQVSPHQRQADGSLEPQPIPAPFVPEFYAGGGGLLSTARDYTTFLQMLMHEGSLNGARILKPETVALMNRNHIGELQAGILKTQQPERSCDVDFFPGMPVRWGLAYMINTQPGPNGRSPGSLTWAGIFNSYYWLDPTRRVAGVILTQILPFADPRAVALYGRFERGIYDLVEAN